MKSGHSDAEVVEPNVTVVDISDPVIAGEDHEVINQDLVQLRSEVLQAKRIVIRLESAVVIYHSTNLALRARSKVVPALRPTVFFGPQAVGTINGIHVHSDYMLMAAADTECQFVVEPGYESVTIAVPPIDFAAHLRERRLRDPLQSSRSVNLLVCDAAKAREFFSLGKRLALTAAQRPDLFNGRKEVCAATETELMDMLLDVIGSAKDYAVTRSDKTHQEHSQIVRVAEAFALAESAGPLRVADLCKAANVSERTLEYAFKELLGMSPVAFLRRVRLHRVHQALKAGTRGTTTVSAEALKWGFWHFGDFSRAYKECFGESPSNTLRQAADRPKRARVDGP